MPRINTEQDFWGRVDIGDENECWNWTGAISPKGYGRFHWQGKEIRSHVLAFTLVNGEPKQQVIHDCMNKLCCNPKHLIDGSTAENHHYSDTSKLTTRIVQTIRHIANVSGFSSYKIAKLFRLNENTVRDVVKRRTWK